jgi:hypothetical protein
MVDFYESNKEVNKKSEFKDPIGFSLFYKKTT